MRALAIHWNLDPVMFSLGDHVFRWYSVLQTAAIILAWFFTFWWARREHVRREALVPLMFWVLVAFFAGGKLGFRYFYATGSFSGLSIFGAAVAIFLVMWVYSMTTGKRYDMSFLWFSDRLMLYGFFLVMTRIGNFCNSELYGTPTDLPWGVIFDRVDSVTRHPVQLYEAAAFLVLFCVTLWLYLKRLDKMHRGFLAGLNITAAALIRFLLEFFKVSKKNIDFGNFSLHTAQVLCIPLFLLGLGILLYVRRHPVPSRLRK